MKTKMVIRIAAIVLASGLVAQAQQVDNAALLYYQAFLLYEPPDDSLAQMITDYRKGKIESNKEIAEHIEKNRIAIEFVVKAADMDTCDWGYDYSQGFDLQMPNLSQVRRIGYLLSIEARWSAEQGDYARAMDRCITLRRVALHVADRTLVSYLVGLAANGLANGAIQSVLGRMPDDVKQLNEFKDQLNQTQGQFPTLERALAHEAQVCAESMRIEKAKELIDMMAQESDLTVDLMIRRLREGDKAFFDRNRNHYINAVGTIIETLESNLPYAQMCARLDELSEQFCEEAPDDPDATLTAMSLPAIRRVFQLEVRQRTHVKALNTAIDLYVAKARTGRLPEALPAGSPPDLFSGKLFEYEKSAEGFVLRCRAKETPDRDEPYEYEFIVKE